MIFTTHPYTFTSHVSLTHSNITPFLAVEFKNPKAVSRDFFCFHNGPACVILSKSTRLTFHKFSIGWSSQSSQLVYGSAGEIVTKAARSSLKSPRDFECRWQALTDYTWMPSCASTWIIFFKDEFILCFTSFFINF